MTQINVVDIDEVKCMIKTMLDDHWRQVQEANRYAALPDHIKIRDAQRILGVGYRAIKTLIKENKIRQVNGKLSKDDVIKMT